MVITCPKCAAKYKLPPDKIQGRGAKITCPRCSNVFVVFNDGATAGVPEGLPLPVPPSSSVTAPAVPREAGVPRSAGAGVGMGVVSSSTRPATPPGSAPSSPSPVSSPPPIGKMAPGAPRPIPSGEGSSPDSLDTEARTIEFAVKADRLNFREVGIQTWKVKVASGIPYEFSDIRTLRRYLDDKKVTPDDQISWDGKNWVRIGDVGDLDRYFIKVWTEARDRKDSGDPVTARTVKVPAVKAAGAFLDEASKLVAEAAAAEDAASGKTITMPALKPGAGKNGGGTGSKGGEDAAANAYRVDLKIPARKTKAVKEEEPRRGGRAMVFLLCLVVLMGGGWWWASRGAREGAAQAAGSGSGVVAGAPGKIKGASQSSMDRFQADVEARLKAAREEQAQKEGMQEPMEVEGGQGSRMVPVIPQTGSRAQISSSPPPTTSSPLPTPRIASTPPPVMGSTGSSRVEDVSASDYAALGASALSGGRYGEAAQQYSLAVGLESGNAQYRYQYAQSLNRAGRTGEAEAQYQKAVELDSSMTSSLRILGELAEKRGDKGAASRYYNRYLEATPAAPDASSVKKRLAELGP